MLAWVAQVTPDHLFSRADVFCGVPTNCLLITNNQAMWPSCHPSYITVVESGEIWWSLECRLSSRSFAIL